MNIICSDCFSEAECGWCEFTDEGSELNPKCCRLKEDCSFGKTTSANRDTCDGKITFITWFVTRLTRQVPLVEQELLTLPEHPSSPMDFSGVHVCPFVFWLLCCLSFNLRILISFLLFSSSSYNFILIVQWT